jgi:hypothetical protein
MTPGKPHIRGKKVFIERRLCADLQGERLQKPGEFLR